MTEQHPTEALLIDFAFADTTAASNAVERHVARCIGCGTVVDTLRRHGNAIRLAAVPAFNITDDCLDPELIAAFAEGTLDPADLASAINHLSDCDRCRREVASVGRLLEAPAVRSEIDRLDVSPERRRGRRLLGVMVVTAALAAGLLFMLLPASSRVAEPLYREVSVTGDVAPRLVAPIGAIATFDAFRWTSVPRADRYRIAVFGRDGSLVWEKQTRDTAIAFPEVLRRTSADTLLWRVEAHVGWEDRWAASDLAMLLPRFVPR